MKESENCEWCEMIILKCRRVGFSPLDATGWALGKCTCKNKEEYIKNYELIKQNKNEKKLGNRN
jgi:hypothetical protein